MKKIIFINFFIFIFIILFLEFTFNFFKLSGLMGIQSGLIYEKNGFHFLSPNTSGTVFGKKVYTDKYGFRVPNSTFQYDNKKNILIIGDSTTFGNGVIEQETFTGILRNKYKKINFFNSAVPGYQIRNHNENLKTLKKSENFKELEKIIYFFSLNDVFSVSNVTRIDSKKIEEGDNNLKKIKAINFLNSNLRNKSYLYMYLKGISSDPSKRWYQSIDKYYSKNSISEISNYFLDLKKYAKEKNADFHLFVIPYEYQTRKCDEGDLIPQKKIADIFNKNKINFFDLTREFCDNSKPNSLYYKFDPAHLSVNGHKFVFNLINEKINF